MHDKRTAKMKSHYDILINGQKFKIMNYIISATPCKHIRLITKIRGQQFCCTEEVKIEILNEQEHIVIQGRWFGSAISPTLEDHRYNIV